jgi:hypothetical protein
MGGGTGSFWPVFDILLFPNSTPTPPDAIEIVRLSGRDDLSASSKCISDYSRLVLFRNHHKLYNVLLLRNQIINSQLARVMSGVIYDCAGILFRDPLVEWKLCMRLLYDSSHHIEWPLP